MGGKLLTLANFLLHFKAKRTQLSLARFKLLTLLNFLLHFKSKSTQMSSARFEPDQILKHNNAFTSVPLVHSCVKVGKLLTLTNFLLYPIFYFISSQKAHKFVQRDLNETKF